MKNEIKIDFAEKFNEFMQKTLDEALEPRENSIEVLQLRKICSSRDAIINMQNEKIKEYELKIASLEDAVSGERFDKFESKKDKRKNLELERENNELKSMILDIIKLSSDHFDWAKDIKFLFRKKKPMIDNKQGD